MVHLAWGRGEHALPGTLSLRFAVESRLCLAGYQNLLEREGIDAAEHLCHFTSWLLLLLAHYAQDETETPAGNGDHLRSQGWWEEGEDPENGEKEREEKGTGGVGEEEAAESGAAL